MGKVRRFAKTKIVATVGPASADERTLRKMIRGGLAVARLNFSHGHHDQHREVIARTRKISREEGIPVAILQDLCGPKIRLGQLPEPVLLKRGQSIELSVEKDTGAPLYTDFTPLVDMVRKGETILINDGYIELTVKEIHKRHLVCKVKVPGIVTSRKGINLPESDASIPVFTPKDKEDLAFGLDQGVDMVAMSFVDSPANIDPIKEMMRAHSVDVPVIAKIERPVALKKIDSIMDAFDGIMIARGDLGVEVPPENVPVIQKRLIQMANEKRKLVITATQMLESMMDNPRPTRAEASDVFNTILDGSDAVMLSGETAAGRYPVKAVGMMQRIARTTEKSKLYRYSVDLEKKFLEYTDAIVHSAARIAHDIDAKYIVVFTMSGNTALRLSKYRPSCPVYAFSPNKYVVAKMTAYWGIRPLLLPVTETTDQMIDEAEKILEEEKRIDAGDLVVQISGVAPMKGATNMLKISRFGEDGV